MKTQKKSPIKGNETIQVGGGGGKSKLGDAKARGWHAISADN